MLMVCTCILFASNCTPTQTTQQEPTPKETTSLPDKVLVLLKPRAQPTPLVEAFAAYELKNEGRSSRTENRWLFSFNNKLITPKEFLTKVKDSDLVLEAELAPLKTN